MTSVFGYIPQSDTPPPTNLTLPTMYDLPSENPEEPGLADEFHFLQPLLLYLTFVPTNWNPGLVFSACDLNLYYDTNHTLWYKRPDWFGVIGVRRLYQGRDLRLSYVTWQEKVNPFVVVELLSPGTEEEDLGETEQQANKPPTKWKVYEDILQVPYYIVFSRYTNEIKPYKLVDSRYKAMDFSSDGQLLMPELGLSLGLWQGIFRGIDRLWLRWFTITGELIPLPEEKADSAKQEADSAKQEATSAKQEADLAKQEANSAKQEANSAKQEADLAKQEADLAKQEANSAKQEADSTKVKAEKLAEKLRQLGINPDEIE